MTKEDWVAVGEILRWEVFKRIMNGAGNIAKAEAEQQRIVSDRIKALQAKELET